MKLKKEYLFDCQSYRHQLSSKYKRYCFFQIVGQKSEEPFHAGSSLWTSYLMEINLEQDNASYSFYSTEFFNDTYINMFLNVNSFLLIIGTIFISFQILNVK